MTIVLYGAIFSFLVCAGDTSPQSELTDDELYDCAKAEPGEYFPAAVTKRLVAGDNPIEVAGDNPIEVAGDNPIKVYREYRGMTQADLARRINISAVYLSQIETGNRGGSPKVISALAKALRVDIDDVI